MRCLRKIILVLLVVGLAGCTDSPTLLKVLYGQFDNVMARELLSYADFSAEQKAQIRSAVDATVRWHRREALPSYVSLLMEIEQRMLDTHPSIEDITWLENSALAAAKDFETQSPMLKLLPLISALSDEQVTQITEKIAEEFEEQREEIENEADQDQATLATKNLTKFFKRVGLRLSSAQKDQAYKAFQARQLTDEQRMQAWRNWADQLLLLLEDRQTSEFSLQFSTHYAARFDLIERTFPAASAHDQEIIRNLMLDLFQNLSNKQKSAMRSRFETLSGVMQDLAQN